jgi:flagellar hook-length control protein FliK
MAQIPILPQITGGKSSASTASVGDLDLLTLSAEGMVDGIPFDLALQQLLNSQNSEETLQLFALQLPVGVDDQSLPLSAATQEGRLLPLSLQVDGKSLPQISEPLVSTAPESPKPVSMLSANNLMPEAAVPRLVQLVNHDKPIDMIPLTAGEGGDRALLETSRGSDSVSQFSLNTLSQATTSVAGSRPSIVLPLNTPVGQPGWDQAVGERIQWMVNQNIQQAEIKLTPPNLGPMEIKVSIHNDQTNVTFIAAQAPTREALESSIPRLREMLGEINLNLANVDVGQQQAGEPGGEGKADIGRGGGAIENDSAVLGGSGGLGDTDLQAGNGLLDTYA